MTTKATNGTRKTGIIISTSIGILLFIGSIFMSVKAIIEDYAANRINTDSNSQKIQIFESEKGINEKRFEELQKSQAISQTKIEENRANLENILKNFNILRVEVKDLAENKINSLDFWREDKSIKDKLTYLERHHPLL